MTKPTPPKPFLPGQSGNPSGRPPGRGLSAELREAIAKSAPGLIRKLMTQARKGDTAAARLLLERVLPPVKSVEEPVVFDLPEGTLSQQAEAMLNAAAAGQLSPAQAAQLIGALAAKAQVTKIDEHDARLTELETRLGQQ